jgi:hypothetical protein
VARRQTYRRRKKASGQGATSLWVGLVLAGLTAINVYVFFFRDDTSVSKLRPKPGEKAPASDKTANAMAKDSGRAVKAAARAAVLPGEAPGAGAATPGQDPAKAAATAPAPGEAARVVEGTIGDNDTLGAVIEREGLGPAAPAVLRALSRLTDPRSIQPGDA